MDNPTQKSPSSSMPAVNTDLAGELAHATQQMYKKNFELVERNKTLSVLRKINEIILSSVTDTKQIAQQVADMVVVEAEFKAVIILVLNKDAQTLEKLAVSQTEAIARVEVELKRPFYGEKISLTNVTNFVVKAVKERSTQVTHDMMDVLAPYYTAVEVEKIETIVGIQSSLIYPLIVREEIIGAMIISISQSEESLFQFQKDLIDRLAGVIGIAIDNAMLYQEIQQANESIKHVDKMKDEFVSLTSHELKTPMTAIKSYLWMALAGKGGQLAEKQKYYLDHAYKATDRLIKMVNDMLNVSRIEAGRIVLNLRTVKLDLLINDVIAEILPRAQEIGVIITYAPVPSVPDVLADPDKIKEVLLNLIGNSLKFTPKGGKITISLSLVNNMIVTKIEDTGRGIAPEDLPKLFQKFGTISQNYLVKQSADGTGLGLYISKSLVELHGGKIWATSQGLEKGAAFNFSLKIATKPV